ncbi:hypothetical protein Pla22_39780 [Rubripirellula amarantea]|uniref:Uncharacterized protein n=1 Tax=Rubripirellula amarantea TaxID=2527999 RepID=A0A5C5WM81_9BACT|nr:hypothetical protein [Rubripirellula amarantea]TWT51201.1 hypothetical protein Pla22_39780 [Rubripirellula amarantea]
MKSQPRYRRGIAFLMIVMSLLVVVITGMQLTLRSELADRRAEANRERIRLLERAIETVTASQSARWTLPLDELNHVRIVVTRDPDSDSVSAKWMMGDRELDAIVRRDRIKTEATSPKE